MKNSQLESDKKITNLFQYHHDLEEISSRHVGDIYDTSRMTPLGESIVTFPAALIGPLFNSKW